MGWKTSTIYQNDTLQRLALRELGHAGYWHDIAALNNLKPPYLADTGDDGVLAYGQTILLPISIPDSLSRVDDAFLTDILLDDNGFISFSEKGINTVSGNENLYQALSLRASVAKTSLMFHPDYGSWAFTLIGNINGSSLAALASFYTKSALLEDPRVESVESISVALSGDTMDITATVISKSGDAIVYEFNVKN